MRFHEKKIANFLFSKKDRAADCRRLCEDPFEIETNPDALKNQQFFEEKCQNSLGVAIKELRIDTLSRFKRLYEEPEKFGEFKFVHLVRDPRSMLASRIKLAQNYDKLKWGNMWPMTLERSMEKHCDKDVRIFRKRLN